MKKHIFFISVGVLFTQILSAQSGAIFGKVNDSISGESVVYAHVIAIDDTDSTNVYLGITDEKGHYRIDQLPYGDYRIKFSCLGYKTKFINSLKLSPEQRRINLDIPVNIDLTVLDAAVIIADRPSIEFRPDKKIVHIDLNATGSGESVADFLRSIPEVRVDGDNVTLKTFAPTVLVNGKPASAAMKDLVNLPASLISSVEIITNPSVRYNPEGLGGIINLKTRRMAEGINGMMQASAGTNAAFNGAGTLNYRTKKWNLFANVFDRYSGTPETGTLDRQFESGETLLQSLESTPELNRISTRVGADFEPDSVNVFSAYWEFSRRSGTRESRTVWEENGLQTSRSYLSEQLSNLDSRDHQVGLNYTHTFKNESELSVDLTHFSGYEPTNTNFLFKEIERPSYYNEVDFNMKENMGDINYSASFGDYEFESGAWFEWEQTDVGDSLSGTLVSYNTLFNLNRQIHAGYASLGKTFGKFDLNVGVRGEYVNQKLNFADFKPNNDYFSFFPNAGVSYRVNDKTSVNLNYGRRIRRPNIFDLTPYASIDSEYPSERFIGNPDLEPAYTNSIDLGGYFSGKKFAVGSSVSYMRTDNDIAEVYFSQDSLAYSSKKNIATSQKILFSANIDYHSKILNIYRPVLSFRLGQDLYDTPDAAGENVHKSFFNYHINLYNLFYLAKNFYLIIDVTYYPETYYYASTTEASTDLSFTLRKTFKNRLTLQISGRNILNSNPTSHSYGDGFESHRMDNLHTQAIFLGVMYKFGKPIKTKANVELNLNQIEAQ